MHVQQRINIGIVGATGYAGAELTELLVRHPGVQISRLFAGNGAGSEAASVHPRLRGLVDMRYETFSPEAAADCDLLFTALPSGESMNAVAALEGSGITVIDLSGDFRLEPDSYEAYYGHEHVAPHLLPGAVYGLTEWARPELTTSTLVANPGCYPTGAVLPLVPLLKAGLLGDGGEAVKDIVIASMSGASGAGRSGSLATSFSEVNENIRAYRVGSHQHIPEIERALRRLSGRDVSVTFTPHLVPMTRGIYTTISAPLAPGVDSADVADAYNDAYGSEQFIRVLHDGVPEIGSVVRTNCADIGYRVEERTGRITLLSTIDNLMKGAAGQAVQNFNVLMGFPEAQALR